MRTQRVIRSLRSCREVCAAPIQSFYSYMGSTALAIHPLDAPMKSLGD